MAMSDDDHEPAALSEVSTFKRENRHSIDAPQWVVGKLPNGVVTILSIRNAVGPTVCLKPGQARFEANKTHANAVPDTLAHCCKLCGYGRFYGIPLWQKMTIRRPLREVEVPVVPGVFVAPDGERNGANVANLSRRGRAVMMEA
ncbi:MAG: hypothetical protein AB7O26_12500 [Planctomycetaceae bacterium]